MSQSSYIKLVEGSKQQEITLDDAKQLLVNYQQVSAHTGQQLNWGYVAASFPYDIEEKEVSGVRYLWLKGNDPVRYAQIFIGVGQEEGKHHIQLMLPTDATHGDKGKANELAKFMAKQLLGELHLFNKRVIYYNPRKG